MTASTGGWPLATTTLRERTEVAVADPVLRRNVARAVCPPISLKSGSLPTQPCTVT